MQLITCTIDFDAGLHIYSQINQGLIHLIWFTSVAHWCTISLTKSLIYFKTHLNHMHTNLSFYGYHSHHTLHSECQWPGWEVWGVTRPHLLNTQLPTCLQCISLSFCFTDPHAKEMFLHAVPMEWPHLKSMVDVNTWMISLFYYIFMLLKYISLGRRV